MLTYDLVLHAVRDKCEEAHITLLVRVLLTSSFRKGWFRTSLLVTACVVQSRCSSGRGLESERHLLASHSRLPRKNRPCIASPRLALQSSYSPRRAPSHQQQSSSLQHSDDIYLGHCLSGAIVCRTVEPGLSLIPDICFARFGQINPLLLFFLELASISPSATFFPGSFANSGTYNDAVSEAKHNGG